MAHQNARLTVDGKFGPVLGHRSVHVEQSPVDQHQRGQVRNRLGGRPDIDEGIRSPGRRAGLVPVAAPHIHDRLTIKVYSDGRPQFITVQMTREGGANASERLVTLTLHLCHVFLLWEL